MDDWESIYFDNIDQKTLEVRCQQLPLKAAGKVGLCQTKALTLKGILGLAAVTWNGGNIILYVSYRFNEHVVAKHAMRRLAKAGLLTTTIRQEPPAPAVLLSIFNKSII